MQHKNESIVTIAFVTALLLFFLAMISGCGTIAGIGRDLEHAAQFMSGAFHQPSEELDEQDWQ